MGRESRRGVVMAAGGGKRIAIDVTKLMMSDAFDVQLNGDLMTDLHVLFQGPKDSASPLLLQRSALQRSAAQLGSPRANSSRARRPVRGRRLASARAATGGLSLQGGPAVFRSAAEQSRCAVAGFWCFAPPLTPSCC